MSLKSVSILVALTIVIMGCSKDSFVMDGATPQSPVIVTPSDGQGGVRLDAGIVLTFAGPVDRFIVERSLHLINERSMADSLCPLDTTMSHGMMATAMMDSMKMNHLMSSHSTRGRFSWLGNNTACTFIPDSMMTPLTQYMIHLGGEMMQMMQERLGGTAMGMMGGHNFSTRDEMVFHFMTMDTAATGGGHGGHH